MDTENRNNPELYNMYDNTFNIDSLNNEENMYSINRYNDRRFDNRQYDGNMRYDFDRMYDRRYNRRFDDRYYRYPYCDRYGRCQNPIWWLFWPFFFF